MATFSYTGGAPYGGLPNAGIAPGGLPIAMSFRPPAGLGAAGFDADPITPGNQSTPGVVTATGPSRFVSGGAGGIGASVRGGAGGFQGGIGLPTISTNPGFIQGGGIAGGFGNAVDADPITPGIQAQPGVVTAIGPPRVVSGPTTRPPLPPASFGGAGFGASSYGATSYGATGFGTAGVGYGAINTATTGRTITTSTNYGGQIGGIISNPVPPVIAGIGASFGSGIAGRGVGGAVYDADPITPGIQSQPGVVTAVGPPRVVSGPTISSGIAGNFGNAAAAVYDADPITPGIQAQPGVVTATGPSTVVSNAYRSSGIVNDYAYGGVTTTGGGMLSSGVAGGMLTSGTYGGPPYIQSTTQVISSGIQQNFGYGAQYDADPITPGIQLQPGTFTATGPSTMLSSTTGITTTFPTTLVDADPFTPGIQAQPGIVTATGPTTVVGGMGLGSITGVNTLQQSVGFGGGVIDADPITPGIQSQPGFIQQTGPTVVVGSVVRNRCPWWLWPLLGLLLLAGLIGGLYACFKPKAKQSEESQESQEAEEDVERKEVKTECTGYLNTQGDCVSCPQGSEWNGKTCTYTASPQTTSERTTVSAEEGETPSGEELPSSITSSSGETAQSSNKKVAVFSQEANEQAIQSALKGAAAENGFAPTIITSKPIPSQPSSVVDASNGSATAESQYTSTNLVTVPAITSRKSVAPTITYSGWTASASGSGAASSGSARSNYVSRFSKSSSGSSSQSSGQSGSSTTTTTKTTKTRKVTRTITSERDEVVSPITSNPFYKHLKRQTA